MLWHTYQHMINGKMRLISVADLVSLSEHFVTQIDWEKVRHAYPALIQALALFHAHAPLSDALVQAARLPINGNPVPIGEDLQGWPRVSFRLARQIGWRRFLNDTYCPSEWWLRLYYGIKNGRTLPAYRWIVHPLEIFRIAMVRLLLRAYEATKRSTPLMNKNLPS
jgi:hypothetical protein